MPKGNFPLLAFNRGEVSPLALARVDIERIRLSAEQMRNWTAKTQGGMTFRAGLQYLNSSLDDQSANWIEFVASTTDTALLELTDEAMRVWIDDELLTRPSVATTISNGSFATSASWTDSSANGGTLTFGGSGLILNATNIGGLAKCTRTLTIAGGDQNVEHAFAIHVTRGPITFKAGSSSGADDYITETTIQTGYHSLSFTPTGASVFISFESTLLVDRIVSSIAIEPAGVVEVTTPWASADLDMIRYDQSADVVFVACSGYRQQRIERRGTGRSWSVVDYITEDGPFYVGRTANVKLKPGATFGNTTLTSDKPFFKPEHVGAIFNLFHIGRSQSFRIGAEDAFTDAVRVFGISSDKDLGLTRSGTWVGTLTLQRSYDGPTEGFLDGTFYTTNGSVTINPGSSFDNIVNWYRVGFRAGDYTSGTAIVTLTYKGDGVNGRCRVTGYTSSTSVNIEVIDDFGSADYTDNWREGYWSDLRGWPTCVSLHEGRLWWAGKARFFGSISDNYSSYDDSVTGDSGPIVRSIASGPVDTVNFMVSLQRLLFGTAGAESSVKSSSFDEPLTPTNTQAKNISTQGSALLRAVKVDGNAIFVQRSGGRIFELAFEPKTYDYASRELTLLNPTICSAGVEWIAVQRQPDTRIHLGLSTGIVAILTYEPAEDVFCFNTFETDGFVERGMVLPGVDEDQVYYHIRREITGVNRRYLEKWALESETVGGDFNKQADSFIIYDGASTTTITGLDHLERKNVVVWANSDAIADVSDPRNVRLFNILGGSITLPSAAEKVVVGLPYVGRYKSTKLAYAAAMGSALTQPKRLNYLGLVLANTHMRGLKVGCSFDVMDGLPLVHEGAIADEGTIYSAWDAPAVEVPGSWDTDSRLCLEAGPLRPVTVLAAVLGLQTHDKA